MRERNWRGHSPWQDGDDKKNNNTAAAATRIRWQWLCMALSLLLLLLLLSSCPCVTASAAAAIGHDKRKTTTTIVTTNREEENPVLLDANGANIFERRKQDQSNEGGTVANVGDSATAKAKDTATRETTKSFSSTFTSSPQPQQQQQHYTATTTTTTTTSSDIESPRIINGYTVPAPDRFPYTVSLQSAANLRHFCGGSLIAPDIVMTAAHCVRNLHSTPLAVRIDPYRLSAPQSSSTILPVSQIRMHPLYRTITRYDHDVALLQLNHTTTTTIQQLSYIRINKNPTLPWDGQSMTVLGWGTTDTSENILPNTLQAGTVVAIADNNECVARGPDNDYSYEGEITEDMLCAIEAGQGACHGDSGGPLILPAGSTVLANGVVGSLSNILQEDVQVGIVSWGIGCAQEAYPGVYTRISEEYDFLRKGVCELSSAPPSDFDCEALFRSIQQIPLTFSPAPTTQPIPPSISAAPTADPVFITVRIQTDSYPGEIGWTLVETTTNATIHTVQVDTYDRPNDVFATTLSVVANHEYALTVTDSFGDGMCCGHGHGSIFVFWGTDADDYSRVLAYHNGRFPQSVRQTFVVSELSVLGFNEPSAAPTRSETPSVRPTSTGAPTAPLVCVRLRLTFDTYPIQTGWTLQDSTTGEVIAEAAIGQYGPFLGPAVTETFLLKDKDDTALLLYNFTLLDVNGDGMCCENGRGQAVLYLCSDEGTDRVLVLDDGRFRRARSHSFVLSPDATFVGSAFPTMVPTKSPAPTSTTPPTATDTQITLQIRLDAFPQETGWSIVEERTGRILRAVRFGAYGQEYENQVVTETFSVLPEEQYLLEMLDLWGDGLNGDGQATVYLGSDVDDTLILTRNGGRFGSSSKQYFSTSIADTLVQAMPSVSPISAGTQSSSLEPPAATAVAAVAASAPVPESIAVQDTSDPSVLSTLVNVTVAITLDRFPTELGWYVQDDTNTKTRIHTVSQGQYNSSQAETTIMEGLVLEKDKRYILVLTDRAGDGICCLYGKGHVVVRYGDSPESTTANSGRETVLVQQDGRFSGHARLPFIASPAPSRGSRYENTGSNSTSTPMASPPPPPLPSSPTGITSREPNPTTITLFFRLDSMPHEFGWALFDQNNNELAGSSPGSYTIPGQIDTHTIDVLEGFLYKLFLVDTGHNGLCCDGAVGVSLGTDAGKSVVFYSNGRFGSYAAFDVLPSPTSILDDAPFFDATITVSPSLSPSVVTLEPTSLSSQSPTSPLNVQGGTSNLGSNNNSAPSAGVGVHDMLFQSICWGLLIPTTIWIAVGG